MAQSKEIPKNAMYLIVLAIVIIAAVAIYSYAKKPVNEVKGAQDSTVSEQTTQAPVNEAELLTLAKALKDNGAKLYGASWCGHCKNQKEMFGAAASELPYVECDQDSPNGDPKACEEAGITGFPTWIINGKQYVGEQSIDQLKSIINL